MSIKRKAGGIALVWLWLTMALFPWLAHSGPPTEQWSLVFVACGIVSAYIIVAIAAAWIGFNLLSRHGAE